MDEYRTIEKQVNASLKVAGSRFQSGAFPVRSKGEADEIYNRVRREFHDATHNCYAYRVGTTADEYRFSDDGEPSGTAGRPILEAIDHQGLTDILLVVTRYFGGTKLGTGGLIRAYREAAGLVLESATVVRKYVFEPIQITFPHEQTGNVMRVVSRDGVEIRDTSYDEEVHLHLGARKSIIADFTRDLRNATAGNIRFGGLSSPMASQ